MALELKPTQTSDDGTQQYQILARPPGWKSAFEVQDRLVSNPKHPLREFNPIGRTDNLIVLASGEKVLPTILEATLSESEHISAAIVFGDGQFELGVIVEPTSALSSEEYDQFRS